MKEVYVLFVDYGLEGCGAPHAVFSDLPTLLESYPKAVEYENYRGPGSDYVYKKLELDNPHS